MLEFRTKRMFVVHSHAADTYLLKPAHSGKTDDATRP